MNRLDPCILDYYNNEVVNMIVDKYGTTPMMAFKMFITSKTHEMLEDEDCGLTDFGAGAIFDMWEREKVTGDPKNSIYIRGE